ncbi:MULTISPECIES: hypothetical protein [Brevibacillus]|jgi:deferrochelatase/peroxidase EfeB|uniref:Uncharacterized protein n=1 Tax=Brevibacillus borstelensis AK1 TaxID=1300222 RepID=M8E3J1_9BACL|nr:hypothetical protein [Brevibacillus borstelensis]EMT53856.1 hypothetical protein I532_07570 [Brevibacillus borstelensis AK1]KKX56743.1 hypothetical protein X546_01870 [Brevibacillus borstelensis cifa_chp40]MBE5395567.1 hypothetical protein [Brevibacillus borstelensis]MCC0565623.1 hypothetical protein [Brevibacillus borstelensis]MCM3470898.1 hypothetical protein [Brevibacillus borstelensis]
MSTDKETRTSAEVDVYEQARISLVGLIQELCEALDETDAEAYKRKGYEMIGQYYKTPVHTGELTLTCAAVLEDILHKLEMTQQGDQVTMVRGPYSIMKMDDHEKS